MASAPAKDLSLRYHECGNVSVNSFSEIVVMLSEPSAEKWLFSDVTLKGSDIDRDTEIVIRAENGFSREQKCFLPQPFIATWPHLYDYVTLCQTLCLIIQDAVFEGIKADIATFARAKSLEIS